MLLLIFCLVLQVTMKPTKVNYHGVKEKMKFGSQELPILTNHYLYHGREQMNDKFNVLIDHI